MRLGRRAGWGTAVELPTRPAEPWRSVDVALTSERHRVILVCECWNSIGDIGAGMRSTDRKRGELAQVAVGRWGADARAASLWIIRATVRNRALVARYPEVFASRFPGSSRVWAAAIVTGGPVPEQPGLVWADVNATRLLEWRRRGE